MPPSLSVRCAALAAMVAAAAPAYAEGLHVRGGGRVLTVSGEPLLAYHLVEPGRSVVATAVGPLVVDLKLRRHSRSLHGGTTRAALDLDGGEMDRFALAAQPAGRYLAGFGFRPGPETARQIKLGPGRHTIAVRAVSGAVVVAFSAREDELQVAPLVAQTAPPAPPPAKPLAAAAPPAPVQPARVRTVEAVAPGPAAETTTVERSMPRPRPERPARMLLELRVGSATQPQVGSTGFGGGADLRYYVAPRWSVGIGVDAYGFALGGKASAAPSPEAVGPLTLGVSLVAVPVLLEAAYDQPLGSSLTLTLGLGAGADYQQFSRSLAAGASALPAPASAGAAAVGEALAALAMRAPGGRIGVELRLGGTAPQDVPGIARGAVAGALLAEVGYQFLH